jgi:NTP pyrophosphatase (non-canonical NTP hydrolase)
MIVEEKLEKYSIDEWENEFAEIYGHVDRKRSPIEIWLLLVEDASKVAEGIRKEKYGEAINALAHVFCWTCSFIWRCRHENDLNVDIKNSIPKIIWTKYPGICCLCGKKFCSCSVNRWENEELTLRQKQEKLKQIQEDLKKSRQSLKAMPKTLDSFTDMFRKIYKGAHYSLAVEAIAFHFMEEVGEVSTCIRNLKERKSDLSKNKSEQLTKALENELADVISWIMSLILKLDYILGAGIIYRKILKNELNSEDKYIQTLNLKLSKILWREFRHPKRKLLCCPTCKKRPCGCTVKSLLKNELDRK